MLQKLIYYVQKSLNHFAAFNLVCELEINIIDKIKNIHVVSNKTVIT